MRKRNPSFFCAFCAFFWLILLLRSLWLLDELVNPAARTFQTAEPLFLDPPGQWWWLVPKFLFRGLGAAMFAESAITQIEEVGRLVHRN